MGLPRLRRKLKPSSTKKILTQLARYQIRDKILQLYQAGIKVEDIANQVAYPRREVMTHLRRAGLVITSGKESR